MGFNLKKIYKFSKDIRLKETLNMVFYYFKEKKFMLDCIFELNKLNRFKYIIFTNVLYNHFETYGNQHFNLDSSEIKDYMIIILDNSYFKSSLNYYIIDCYNIIEQGSSNQLKIRF